jgi:PAS domain S-box-containing protein
MWIYDLKTLAFLEVNDAAVKEYGYTREEFLGMTIKNIHPDEDIKGWPGDVEKTRTELPHPFESCHKLKDGRVIDVEITLHALKYGGRKAAFTTAMNVGERKQAGGNLHKSEERYRTLVTLLPDALFVNVGARLVFANPALCRLLGADDPSQLIGKSVFEIIHPEDHEKVRGRTKLVLSGQPVPLLEEKYLRLDGTVIDVEVAAAAIDWQGSRGSQVIVRDISERKRAVADLRESEEKYRAFFESSMDAILLTSPDGSIQAANPAACKMLGRTEAEICAVGRNGLMDTNDPRLEALLAERMRTGKAFGELTMFRKDGSPFPIEMSSALFRDRQGNTRTSMVVRDVTERRRAEKAARVSTDRQSLILQSLPIVFYTSRPSEDLATTWINEQVEQLTGFTPNYFVEDPMFWSKRIHPDDRDRAIKEYDLMLQNGRVAIEYRWQCADGKYRWFVDQAVLARDERGNPIEVTGIWLDTTERKRVEEELRRLTHAMEQSPLSVMITDTAGNMEYVNPRFTEITGYSVDEVRGKNPRILKSGETSAEEYKKLWETILAGDVWRGEFCDKKKNGELFWESASISPVRDEKGTITHFIAIKEDITAQKLADEKLRENEIKRRELERQLIQSQKLEGLGTLASGIAHDFNNLLGIIMGNASLLAAMNTDATPVQKKNTDAILKAASRGASLVKQMLTFARKTDVLIESVELNDIVNEVLKLLHETFPRTIVVEARLARDLPLIDADATQVNQVLLNLCVNARDAMPQGGILTITTYLESGEELLGKHPKAAAQNYIVLSVADNGFGMDEDTQHRIFEPFFTTKEHGKGTGLGLSLAFGIMESHNGFITFQSELGKGTTFQCYFPLPDKAPALPQAEKAAIEEIPGGGETILVVEDEELLRELLRDILEPKGYTVLTAEDGEEGIEAYSKHRDEIALVISDLGLPKFGGDELYHKLAGVNPNVRMILSSGYIEPAMKTRILKEGVKDFIQKPYNPGEVLRAVRRVFEMG